MKKFLFLILSMFLVVVGKSQTTVTYAQRVEKYYHIFKDGGDIKNQASYQVVMTNKSGNNRVVCYRKFRTDASGASTSDRAMQVGDRFVVNLSAARAKGKIGFALLSSPTSTSSWAERENNYALSVNLDGPTYTGSDYGNWYIKYSGNNTSEANFGGQKRNYTNFTFTMTLIAHDRMNVTITDGTNTANFYDVQLNTGNPITDFTIFLENDYDGSANRYVLWGLGNSYNQFTLKNTGAVSIGESNTSYTISSTIPNGLAANSSSISSTNSLTKKGSRTITLTASNTYSGSTTVSAGILQLDGSLANSDVTVNNGASMILNGPLSTINSLTINSGGIVTVNPNKSLTVTNTLINNAGYSGLVIQSGGTKNGSLIFPSGTPAATVQRSIAGYSDNNHGWHTICSPVDMTVAGSGWFPGDNDDLYAWDETTNQWTNYKPSDAFNFKQGQGYLVAYKTGAVKEFTGFLRSTSITHTNLSRDNANGKGWHLLGNPFSSAIKWNARDNDDWVFTNIGSVPSVWDESRATYANPSVGDLIPATNGFFVQVDDGFGGNNTITIPASAIVQGSADNYKNATSNSEANTLKMTVTTDANTFYNKIRVGFKADATQEWDIKYDAHKMYGAEAAPELWTVSNGEEFSVNTLPLNQEPVNLPLNFKAGADGNYTITFDGIDSFDANNSITLEDLFTGKTVDVRKNKTYNYTATKGDDSNRFVLHINGVTAVPNVNKTNDIQLFAYGNTVYLHAAGQKALEGKISVLNMPGQKVYEGTLNGSSSQQIHMSGLKSGIYFVRVEGESNVVTQKVFLK